MRGEIFGVWLRAENGLQNSYEMDWLKYKLRDTQARLATAGSA